MAAALACFVAGLDEDRDFLRLAHGAWHCLIGAATYHFMGGCVTKEGVVDDGQGGVVVFGEGRGVDAGSGGVTAGKGEIAGDYGSGGSSTRRRKKKGGGGGGGGGGSREEGS